MENDEQAKAEEPSETAVIPAVEPSSTQTETEELPSPAADMVVYARDTAEMARAQVNLIRWADAKIAECRAEADELTENLEAAKKHKWRTSGLASARSRANKRVGFYEKVKAALEAGYIIVPNFPVQVFAVRVVRDPKSQTFDSRWALNRNYERTAQDLAAGEGKYVDPTPRAYIDTVRAPTGNNPNATKDVVRTTGDWSDVDFPTMLARPRVIQATSDAMAHKIFDRLCASPGNVRTTGLTAGGDPMVIGQVVMKHGYSMKTISFLVSWFIDTREL